jgi:hypothetical protein
MLGGRSVRERFAALFCSPGLKTICMKRMEESVPMRLVWRGNCNYELQNNVEKLRHSSAMRIDVCFGCERKFQKNGRLCQRTGSVMRINLFNHGARRISEKPRSVDARASQSRLHKS